MKQSIPEYPYLVYGEDHCLDHALLTQLMARLDPSIKIVCLENGLEVFQFLDHLPNGSLLPGCIILDMDMPIWDGMRTLKVIKEHNEFHHITCLLYSNSTSVRDKALAESLGAEAFISKSYDLDQQKLNCEQFAAFCKRPPITKMNGSETVK